MDNDRKIKLSLSRDETININQFFPLWIMVVDSRMNLQYQTEEYYLSGKILKCIIYQIIEKFEKRLNAFSIHHRFSFTPAEAAVFLEFMLKHPIASDQFWLFKLRQEIVNKIHKQI